MNWQKQLENLYLSQSIIENEINHIQEQIYLESPEYYLQTTKEAIYAQPDVIKYKYKDPDTGLDVYFTATSKTLDKKYLETYHYQAIYRDKEIIGYERRDIERQIVSASTELNYRTIQVK
jgi:hypothetical protein